MLRNMKIRWAHVLMLMVLALAACGGGTTGGGTAATTSAGGTEATTTSGGGAATTTSATEAATTSAGSAATTAATTSAGGAATTSAGGGTAATAAAGGTAAAGATSGKPLNIAVLPKTTTTDYWTAIGQGVQEATKKDPSITTTYEGPSDFTAVEDQIRFIEAAISRKPDAMVVAPIGGAEVQPTLQRAIDAGIPVVLIDSDIPGFAAKSAFVGTDNKKGGQEQGQFVGKMLKSGDKVAILRGKVGDPVANARTDGATETVKAAGLDLIATEPADWDRAKGQSVAENLLTANPDLKAFVCNNDDMALGAIQAAQAAGRNDLIIVGFDANSDALQAIADGKLAGSLAQFPLKIGQLGVETAAKVARGQTVDKFVDTGVQLVTKDNLSQYKK